MTLYGQHGKTEEIWLNESVSSDRSARFDQGSCKTFNLNLPYIGRPFKLRIRHDGSGHSPSWHLEKVRATRNEAVATIFGSHVLLTLQIILQHYSTRKTYFFTCNRWINADDEDGALECELPAFGPDITQPASGTFFFCPPH